MGRQRFSRNSNPHLYVATPRETAEGLVEVWLTPLVGWLVSGEESPNFDSFHLVAVSSTRFPAEQPYAIYDDKRDSWQDLDTSGHGLDSLLQHLTSEAVRWQRFEAECRAGLKRERSALATEGNGYEGRSDSHVPVIPKRPWLNRIESR